MRNDQLDHENNKRVEQKRLRPKEVHPPQNPVPAPDQLYFLEVLQDKATFAVSQIYMLKPREGEGYYLRLLVNQGTGVTFFKDMKTADGEEYAGIRETCRREGC